MSVWKLIHRASADGEWPHRLSSRRSEGSGPMRDDLNHSQTLAHWRLSPPGPCFRIPTSGRSFVERFLQDIKYSLRMFAQQRAFTIAAITALALGIGATTAVFSVVDAVLLRPFPFPDPDRI